MRMSQTVRAGVGLALAGILLAGCTGDDDLTPGVEMPVTSAPTPGPSESPASTSSPTPTASPVEAGVFYLVDTRAGIRLARELHDVAGEDPVLAAVERMIAGADDPDYATAWNPETQVLGVTRSDGTITVDLSEEARTASIGSEGAATMIQQLVWTATAAAGEPDAGVLLTIEGEPAGDLWGAVTWPEPVTRADDFDVRVLVQIDEPAEGTTTTSPVTVSGDAHVFEANLLWRVLDASGVEVKEGFATTAEGQTFAPYSFTVELDPGTWTVEISESDPSGGAGGTPMTDTRTVTVSQ